MLLNVKINNYVWSSILLQFQTTEFNLIRKGLVEM